MNWGGGSDGREARTSWVLGAASAGSCLRRNDGRGHTGSCLRRNDGEGARGGGALRPIGAEIAAALS